MLCIHNLDALIESLQAKGYDVKYKKHTWYIDGKIVDENEIPNLVNGKKAEEFEIVKDKVTKRYRKVKKNG